MICKNCKYWTESDGHSEVKRIDVRKCTKVKMFWDCTEWGEEEDDFERVFTGDAKNNKAFVQDGSDYMAHFLTLSDFGCNQFEDSGNV